MEIGQKVKVKIKDLDQEFLIVTEIVENIDYLYGVKYKNGFRKNGHNIWFVAQEDIEVL